MHVIKRPTILKYARQYPEAREQLFAWVVEAEHAHWSCPQDILDRFNSADFPTDQHVIFDIKGRKYRLVVRIRYANENRRGTVFIRWFGLHKDYDRLQVENV